MGYFVERKFIIFGRNCVYEMVGACLFCPPLNGLVGAGCWAEIDSILAQMVAGGGCRGASTNSTLDRFHIAMGEMHPWLGRTTRSQSVHQV